MHSYLAQFVDELHVLGIEDIVLSPGARSTPLAMLFCAHKFNVYMNVDERSAGFFALGIAKKSQKAVVLLCTSGSAPAHYLPAIMEAKHSRIPLIILSADRPPEFQNIGAPQTVIQRNLFPDFIKYFEELSIVNEKSPQKYPRSVVQKAFLRAMSEPKAPVHINIPLREPLIVEEKNRTESAFSVGRAKYPFFFQEVTYDESAIDSKTFAYIAQSISQKKGIIICGAGMKKTYQEEIINLSEHLNAPILADPLSNFRNHVHINIIDAYDSFLKSNIIKEKLKFDYALLFGQASVSKRVLQFLSYFSDMQVFQIDTCPDYRNPSLTTSTLLTTSPMLFARSLMAYEKNQDIFYLHKWLEEQKNMRAFLNSTQKNTQQNDALALSESVFFEGSLIQSIQNLLPQKSNLAIANSMSIRDVDYFWEKREQSIEFFCNRGVNGIDGTISTALGISCKSKGKTVLITGDLAFLHDINAFLMANKHKLNLIIILINNNGAAIFQYLLEESMPYYNFLFETPHNLEFSALSTLFKIEYRRVESQKAFESHFKDALKIEGVTLIEVPIDKLKSKALHEKYTSPCY